jgi:two-component system response regulator
MMIPAFTQNVPAASEHRLNRSPRATFYFPLWREVMIIQEQAILLVEDNDEDAELIVMAFKRAKISNPVIRVRDGEEALDYLFGGGQQKGLPAVVLLDLGLPRISGFELLRTIRKDRRTENLPAVILTSSDHDRDRVRAYGDLANSYVLKSLNKDQFVLTADQLVRNLMNNLERSAALQEKLTRP